MPATQLLPVGPAAAPRHQAQFPAEHRILRVKDKLISPELRADGRHQAGPQARMPVRGTLPGRDHEVTAASAPAAGTVAVTVTRTPPRQARARSQVPPLTAVSRT